MFTKHWGTRRVFRLQVCALCIAIFLLMFGLDSLAYANQSSPSELETYEKGIIKVDVGTKQYPMFYYKDGELVGAGIEIWNRISEVIGIKVEFVDFLDEGHGLTFEEYLDEIAEAKIDIYGYGYTGGAEFHSEDKVPENYELTVPFMFVDGLITSINNDQIRSIEDVTGKTVETYSSHTKIVKALTEKGAMVISAYPQTTKIVDGSADAGVYPLDVLLVLRDQTYAELYEKIKIVEPVHIEERSFLIEKSKVNLLNAINSAIRTLQKEGYLRDIFLKYYGYDLSIQTDADQFFIYADDDRNEVSYVTDIPVPDDSILPAGTPEYVRLYGSWVCDYYQPSQRITFTENEIIYNNETLRAEYSDTEIKGYGTDGSWPHIAWSWNIDEATKSLLTWTTPDEEGDYMSMSWQKTDSPLKSIATLTPSSESTPESTLTPTLTQIPTPTPITTSKKTSVATPNPESPTEIGFGVWLPEDDTMNQLNEDTKVGCYIKLYADGSLSYAESMPEGYENYSGTWSWSGDTLKMQLPKGVWLDSRSITFTDGKGKVSYLGRKISVKLPKDADEFFAYASGDYNMDTPEPVKPAGEVETTQPDNPMNTYEQDPIAPTVAPQSVYKQVDGVTIAVVNDVRAKDYIQGKDPYAYVPEKMIDGDENTAWQFSTKTNKMKDTYAYFDFAEPITVDELWIKNGFWTVTNGKDQYTRNSRVKELGVAFLYEGESDYTDKMTLKLKDDKKRTDWQKLSLKHHENVIGIRFRIMSIYKGSKYPTDVCISEVMFVRNE